jgi:hypothetical protein
MDTLSTLLGFASGFALMGYHETTANLIATSLAIDATLAPLTAVIARRRGHCASLWAVLGFAFGMWALAAIFIISSRRVVQSHRASSHHHPSPSDAA